MVSLPDEMDRLHAFPGETLTILCTDELPVFLAFIIVVWLNLGLFRVYGLGIRH